MGTTRVILVVGSRNEKKAAELRALLGASPIDLRSLADYPHALDVAEDGDTFERNARQKATQFAAHLGHWVLSDDSGLSVDALGGRPGVYSARYAGAHGDDRANNRKLLAELDGLPPDQRAAHYVCMLVLADPNGVLYEARAECHGRIADAARGVAGFGYDALFIVREYHRTMAELGLAVKNTISHRARALYQFRAALPMLLAKHAPPD